VGRAAVARALLGLRQPRWRLLHWATWGCSESSSRVRVLSPSRMGASLRLRARLWRTELLCWLVGVRLLSARLWLSAQQSTLLLR